jgi:hypothetical protein
MQREARLSSVEVSNLSRVGVAERAVRRVVIGEHYLSITGALCSALRVRVEQPFEGDPFVAEQAIRTFQLGIGYQRIWQRRAGLTS